MHASTVYICTKNKLYIAELWKDDSCRTPATIWPNAIHRSVDNSNCDDNAIVCSGEIEYDRCDDGVSTGEKSKQVLATNVCSTMTFKADVKSSVFVCDQEQDYAALLVFKGYSCSGDYLLKRETVELT